MEKEKDMDYSLMESNISKSDASVSSQHSSPDDSDDNTIINELEKTKTELEHYHKLYNETLSKLKYSLADFDNFRKNIERQNSLKVLSIKADLFSAIINIREDFIRALDLIDHNKVDDGVFEGLKNILKTIDSFLEKEDIKEIESLSKVFDPNVHEIIGFSYHDNDNIEENIVTKEIRKGYLLNDRVLRPSLVEVSKKIVKNNDSVNNTKGDEI
ncbi:MAG: nucleotide exchange factor GrpE [Candidatus Nitrosocosmicus sp.]